MIEDILKSSDCTIVQPSFFYWELFCTNCSFSLKCIWLKGSSNGGSLWWNISPLVSFSSRTIFKDDSDLSRVPKRRKKVEDEKDFSSLFNFFSFSGKWQLCFGGTCKSKNEERKDGQLVKSVCFLNDLLDFYNQFYYKTKIFHFIVTTIKLWLKMTKTKLQKLTNYTKKASPTMNVLFIFSLRPGPNLNTFLAKLILVFRQTFFKK